MKPKPIPTSLKKTPYKKTEVNTQYPSKACGSMPWPVPPWSQRGSHAAEITRKSEKPRRQTKPAEKPRNAKVLVAERLRHLFLAEKPKVSGNKVPKNERRR